MYVAEGEMLRDLIIFHIHRYLGYNEDRKVHVLVLPKIEENEIS